MTDAALHDAAATSDKTPERHLLPVSRLSATVVAGRDHSCPNKNL